MQQYLLKEKEEKLDTSTKPAEEPEVKTPASATSEEVVTAKTEETTVDIVSPADDDESSGALSVVTGESNEATPDAGESVGEATEAAAEESGGNAEPEDSGDQEVEETPEIKVSFTTLHHNFNSCFPSCVSSSLILSFSYVSILPWILFSSLRQHQQISVSQLQINLGIALPVTLSIIGELIWIPALLLCVS